jgi:hypothetical protein
MTIAFRVGPQTELPAANLPTNELAFLTVAAFRAHSHINNVLTHISRGDWLAIERSLQRILDPATMGGLSLLEQNLIDLMCADRGITGRVLKPFFRELLGRHLKAEQMEGVLAHVEALFVQSQERPASSLLSEAARAVAPSVIPSTR